MKESQFQPGDLVRETPDIGGHRGTLLLVELQQSNAWLADINWHALGPRGMVSVWESRLTLISREEK